VPIEIQCDTGARWCYIEGVMDDDRPGQMKLSALCEAADVTERTVRYYTRRGLLPSPGSGRFARYGPEHLRRLRAIQALKARHLPLAAIRAELEAADAEQIDRLAADGETRARTTGSVRDFVESVLGESSSGGSVDPHPATSRSTWERYRVTRDVEVHVRRPLSRTQNERLKLLLELAERVLHGEDPGPS
jgi:DNA-binding transcriptional MerR regulator